MEDQVNLKISKITDKSKFGKEKPFKIYPSNIILGIILSIGLMDGIFTAMVIFGLIPNGGEVCDLCNPEPNMIFSIGMLILAINISMVMICLKLCERLDA